MGNFCVGVGLSGGVDSAVAARLLLDAGHDVVGLTMLTGAERGGAERTGCYAGGGLDAGAAREVARQLGIPHHAIPVADEYAEHVLKWTREQYMAGLTPNPCAVCNPAIKFGALLEKARARGIRFDYFATGHYARIVHDSRSGRVRLFTGIDKTKDQSYFLARLSQDQLANVMFPLGDRTKTEVRRMAREFGLDRLADKPESRDFFDSADRTAIFAGENLVPGPIVNTGGVRVGGHRGIALYTVGQREGLGLAMGGRVYVKEIRAADNTIVVADRAAVMSAACRVADTRWIAGAPPLFDGKLIVRLRYRHAGVDAEVSQAPDGHLLAVFDEPQFAPAPGQMAAFYLGDELMGGGWMEQGGQGPPFGSAQGRHPKSSVGGRTGPAAVESRKCK